MESVVQQEDVIGVILGIKDAPLLRLGLHLDSNPPAPRTGFLRAREARLRLDETQTLTSRCGPYEGKTICHFGVSTSLGDQR